MELSSLLSKAERATPDRRIELRDEIAAHGAPAIEAVRPWLTDPGLAAFAIRVIERAGANEASQAIEVLRSVRSNVPPVVKGDLDWAIKQLRLRVQQATEIAPPPAPRSVPVRRERHHASTAARGRPR